LRQRKQGISRTRQSRSDNDGLLVLMGEDNAGNMQDALARANRRAAKFHH
jgi:hypothetical protein